MHIARRPVTRARALAHAIPIGGTRLIKIHLSHRDRVPFLAFVTAKMRDPTLPSSSLRDDDDDEEDNEFLLSAPTFIPFVSSRCFTYSEAESDVKA